MARCGIAALVCLFSVAWTLVKACDPAECGLDFDTLINDTSIDGLCSTLDRPLPCIEKCLDKDKKSPQSGILKTGIKFVKKICATPQSKQTTDVTKCLLLNIKTVSGCIFSTEGFEFHGFTGEGGKTTFCCTANKKAHCILSNVRKYCSAKASGAITSTFRNLLEPMINKKCGELMSTCDEKVDWSKDYHSSAPKYMELFQKLKHFNYKRESNTEGLKKNEHNAENFKKTEDNAEKFEKAITSEPESAVLTPNIPEPLRREWQMNERITYDDNGNPGFCASVLVVVLTVASYIFKSL